MRIKANHSKTFVILGSIQTMLLWAICYPLISLSLPYAPIMLTAFLRAVIAGSLLIFIAILLKRPVPKTLDTYAYLLTIGITATSIGFWGMFYAGSLITPGLATVLANTQPLIAGLLGWYILNERLGKRALLGTLLGFSGIVVISAESLFATDVQSLSGMAYVVIAAAGLAISNILLKKSANHIDVLYAMGFQLLLGAIPLSLLALFNTTPQPLTWSWDYVWILLTLALPGTALPVILWFWLMNKSPLYKLNVYSFLTPVFGLYLGYTYFSESLSLTQWLGVFLVIAAIPLVNSSTKRNV
ncbi:DMT family transporter [Kangiella aquimarina]|uniref:DMT family transporter n=1 Tax=Kangiella aquimarina TaxID=261965 RepID=A0ABZ0X242_9GAMM|nr:DMT family transporter [Kangiella aquimarina]WQG84444.1 DMT family transporter [Kangiella aquimarina]